MSRAWILLSAILFLGASGVCFAESPRNEEIQVWLEALRSDDYSVREWATQNLQTAGQDAIGPLSDQLATFDVEAAIRGLSILRHFATQEDLSSIRAEEAIQQLAENQATVNAQRAAAVLQSINADKPARAQRILRRLGTEFGSASARLGSQTYGTLTLGENWKGSIQDLRYLHWLPYRRMIIKLSGKHVNDQWLEILAQIPNVYALHIKDASITDEGMSYVEEMPSLSEMRVFYCDLGNKSLKHLSELDSFWAFGTRMTAKELDGLKERHPAMAVRHGLGGFLGISGQTYKFPDNSTVASGVEVDTVTPNGAASQADIRPKDIILEYDGKVVTEFLPPNQQPRGYVPAVQPTPKRKESKTDEETTLSQLIGKNRAGQKVPVKILRNGEYIMKEVELGKWQ